MYLLRLRSALRLHAMPKVLVRRYPTSRRMAVLLVLHIDVGPLARKSAGQCAFNLAHSGGHAPEIALIDEISVRTALCASDFSLDGRQYAQ